MINYSAIILAAGTGSRMGLGYNKMLHLVHQKPVVAHTVQPFLQDPRCSQLILVVNQAELAVMQSIFPNEHLQFVIGGSKRQESVYQGLQQVKEKIVLIHDGARPFVNQRMIEDCYMWATSGVAAVVGVPVKDTIKRVSKERMVLETLERHELFSIQTPQAATTATLKLAHEKARAENFIGTDDVSLIERYTKVNVRIVEGAYTNIKLTTPEDLVMAAELLKGVEKQ